MFTEFLGEEGDVAGIVCEGKLSGDDVAGIHAFLQQRLTASGEPGLVIDFSRFKGRADPAAFLADSRMDVAHRRDFSRIAVIGDRRWADISTALASLITRSEMRWFHTGEADLAADWARCA